MPTARVLWAGLALLDRQLLDRSGVKCGKVDDLELGEPDERGRVFVSGVHTGPGALLRRTRRRRSGDWIARTLGVEPIPIARVADIGDHVTLSLEEPESPAFRGERWVRDHLIGPIPGSGHEAQ